MLIDTGADRLASRVFVDQLTTDGSCTYKISPKTAFFDIPGGEGTFDVIAPAGCTWTAEESNPLSWLTIVGPSSGTGTGVVRYTITPNDGQYHAWRVGSIIIKEIAHSISQTDGSDCPQNNMNQTALSSASEDSPVQKGMLNLDETRAFRDQVLSKTARGQQYTQDYYEYAGEITRMLVFNPRLFYRSKEALLRYQPVVGSVLTREQAKADLKQRGETADQTALEATVVNDAELDDIDELLASLASEASAQLRQKIDNARRDIRDPQVHAEFGIRIAHGDKRALPDEGGRLTRVLGALSTLNFGAAVQYLNPFGSSPTVAEIARGDRSTPSRPPLTGDAYGQIPLSFEANRGQIDPQVKYLSRGIGYSLYLTRDEAVIAMGEQPRVNGKAELSKVVADLSSSRASASSTTLRMGLKGANRAPRVDAIGEMSVKSNYFIGNDPANWQTGIANYSAVEYKQIYKGVDLVYYGNQQQLEYDFKVAPGADPRQIAMDSPGPIRSNLAIREISCSTLMAVRCECVRP